METIGTVTDAYHSGAAVVLTVVRRPDVPYRRWKAVMDALEETVEELSNKVNDMVCKCGNKANFTAHVKERVNGKTFYKAVYLCGACFNRFVVVEMHEQRAKA